MRIRRPVFFRYFSHELRVLAYCTNNQGWLIVGLRPSEGRLLERAYADDHRMKGRMILMGRHSWSDFKDALKSIFTLIHQKKELMSAISALPQYLRAWAPMLCEYKTLLELFDHTEAQQEKDRINTKLDAAESAIRRMAEFVEILRDEVVAAANQLTGSRLIMQSERIAEGLQASIESFRRVYDAKMLDASVCDGITASFTREVHVPLLAMPESKA